MRVLKNTGQRLIGLVLGLSLLPTISFASHETGNGWTRTDWDDQHIIVFSECGFEGRSKKLPLGDHQMLREVGVEHNAISSMIIPNGLAVEIFQKRRFQGHWYRMNQNQPCLKGNWDNRIGSLRVVADNVENSYGFSNSYHVKPKTKRCHGFSVSTINGQGGIRFVDQASRITNVEPGRPLDGEICEKGPLRIELARKERQTGVGINIGGKEFVFEPWAAYDDYRNGWYRKYITVELPKLRNQGNDSDQSYGQNGWGNTKGFGKRYSSGLPNGENWGNNYPRNWNRVVAKAPEADPYKDCVPFVAVGNHKDTGVRFLVGDRKFHRVGDGELNEHICHKGKVKVELAKRKTGAEVVLRVGGKTVKFGRGDAGDRLESNWYRKYVTVNLR